MTFGVDTSANKGILTMSMFDNYMDKHINEYCTFEDNTFSSPIEVIQKTDSTPNEHSGFVNSHDETYFEDQNARNAFMEMTPK